MDESVAASFDLPDNAASDLKAALKERETRTVVPTGSGSLPTLQRQPPGHSLGRTEDRSMPPPRSLGAHGRDG